MGRTDIRTPGVRLGSCPQFSSASEVTPRSCPSGALGVSEVAHLPAHSGEEKRHNRLDFWSPTTSHPESPEDPSPPSSTSAAAPALSRSPPFF